VPLLSHQDVFTKVFGIGLASAVFIEAAVVRMVLVPARIELLGDRNWSLPGWLDRLLPSLHIEGHDGPDDDTAAPEPPSPRPPAAGPAEAGGAGVVPAAVARAAPRRPVPQLRSRGSAKRRLVRARVAA
jgi:hypothetical protein